MRVSIDIKELLENNKSNIKFLLPVTKAKAKEIIDAVGIDLFLKSMPKANFGDKTKIKVSKEVSQYIRKTYPSKWFSLVFKPEREYIESLEFINEAESLVAVNQITQELVYHYEDWTKEMVHEFEHVILEDDNPLGFYSLTVLWFEFMNMRDNYYDFYRSSFVEYVLGKFDERKIDGEDLSEFLSRLFTDLLFTCEDSVSARMANQDRTPIGLDNITLTWKAVEENGNAKDFLLNKMSATTYSEILKLIS